uniref:ornithine decarboxylase n=2 Tax=Clastoptera arizonana TaxID=38151 RepID=A0A1B6CXQ9_9HEMI
MRNIAETDLIHVLDQNTTPETVLRSITQLDNQEEAFYVFDVGDIVKKHKEWKMKLPRVSPFYAVKCNDSPIVLRVLASLGTGFDCASKAEINKILDLGVSPNRIIFANPAKPASHLRHSAAVSVDTMTFDNECELYKVKNLHSQARLVLRIRCDDITAVCPLGIKFGCEITTEAPRLLQVARSLDLNIVGISFHVGSGCRDASTFRRAIAAARELFDFGIKLGFNMQLLDIGGGYPGNRGTYIDKIAEVVNTALDDFFPISEGVQIIAEPGRFYTASAFTLATNIHSKRTSDNHTMYYINDGVYGSFNILLYDHATVEAEPLNFDPTKKLIPCSVWGPTCDGLDQVIENCILPEMDIGEWVVFKNMGAYTLPVASPFNGFPIPKVHAVIEESIWLLLKDCLPLSEDQFTLNSDFIMGHDPWSISRPRCSSPHDSGYIFENLVH